MNRVTIASITFLVFAIGISAWLLMRAPEHEAAQPAAPGVDPHVGMTFAEWSVRSDAVLLADIDPGEGTSTVPRRFLVVKVAREKLTDGASFSWAPADRAGSAGSLFALGFKVSADDRAFVPPDDPMWSDPVASPDGGTEQRVTMRSKGGVVASFTRTRVDLTSNRSWGRRAIGFASPDGHLAYVTPDARVVPIGAP